METMRVLAIIFLLVIIARTHSRMIKRESFCHQRADYPELLIKLRSEFDEADEWCVIIPSDKYWNNTTAPSNDPQYPHVLDMSKVRELCRKFNASLIDIDFKENTNKTLYVKRVLDKLEQQKKTAFAQAYPIDCAYEFNTRENRNVPVCEKGRLPDDYEYYAVYLHWASNDSFPYILLPKMDSSPDDWFKGTYQYVCYQKVNQTEYPTRTKSGSIGTSDIVAQNLLTQTLITQYLICMVIH